MCAGISTLNPPEIITPVIMIGSMVVPSRLRIPSTPITMEAIVPVATIAVKKLFMNIKQTAAIQQTVPTRDCHKSVGKLSTRSKNMP